MSGIIGAIATLAKVYDKLIGDGEGSPEGAYSSILSTVKLDDVQLKLLASGGSMVEFSNNLIIEPPIVVTRDAYNRGDVDKILSSSVDVYAAMYLQAFKALISIYGLTTNSAISVLSTKGFDVEAFSGDIANGINDVSTLESLSKYINRDKHDAEDSTFTKSTQVSISNDDLISTQTIIRTLNIVIDSSMSSSTTLNDVKETVNHKKQLTVNIPLTIKASVTIVDFNALISSVTQRSKESSFGIRLLKAKVGAISWRDFFLVGDLVEQYKQEALTSDNFSSSINKISRQNINLNTLMNKQVGLNKMVVTYILTDRELDKLCIAMGYKIGKSSDKNELMNALMAFNITSINTDRDRVSIYINGISGMTTSDIKSLTKGGKGDTNSIEVLAAALLANKLI